MFLQALFNAVFQVVLFSIIPLIWWLITARKKENFFSWLGFKKPVIENKKKWILIFITTIILCWLLAQFAIYLRGPMEAAESQYTGMGASAIPSVLAYAFLQTALSEEILFRGFLLKRLSSKFGFNTANIIQAAIFGAVHLLMVWGQFNFLAGFVIVVYPMVVAVAFSYINEKLSKGSILPSWLIHGILNTLSGLIAAL